MRDFGRERGATQEASPQRAVPEEQRRGRPKDPPLLTLFEIPIVVAFHVPAAIVPNVVILVDPAHELNAVFSTFPNPTSEFDKVVQDGAALTEPFPVWDKNFLVVVVLPASFDKVFAADA